METEGFERVKADTKCSYINEGRYKLEVRQHNLSGKLLHAGLNILLARDIFGWRNRCPCIFPFLIFGHLEFVRVLTYPQRLISGISHQR